MCFDLLHKVIVGSFSLVFHLIVDETVDKVAGQSEICSVCCLFRADHCLVIKHLFHEGFIIINQAMVQRKQQQDAPVEDDPEGLVIKDTILKRILDAP